MNRFIIRDFNIFWFQWFENPNQIILFPIKIFFLDLIKIDIWRGLILYINEQLPRKMLINHENSIASETVILEFHQLKSKWLMIGIYKLPNQKETEFLLELTYYSPVLLIYTPWKHQKIFRFSDVFRGCR